MQRDVTHRMPDWGPWHRQSGPARWLAIGLGGTLLLVLLFAQAVRAAAPGIVTNPGALTVGEGRSSLYAVALVGSLSDDQMVTVNIASDNEDVTLVGATDHDDDTDTPNVLVVTFTADNDDEEQLIEVKVDPDADAVDEGATLTHTITPTPSDLDGFTGLPPVTLRVSVEDDDKIGVAINRSTIVVAEPNTDTNDGTSITTYTVKLKSMPKANVMVKITSDNDKDVKVHGGSASEAAKSTTLTFNDSATGTDGSWADTQTVTVTVIEDATTGEESAMLTHAISSDGDAAYNALDDMTVTVIVTDPDEANFVIDTDTSTPDTAETAPLALNEGDSGEYFVKLSAEPTHDVRVSIASSDSGVTVSPSTLTFKAKTDDDSRDYDTAQTVTVRVARDADTESEEVTLTHTASSQDPMFNKLRGDKVGKVSVNVNDTTETSPVTFVAANAAGDGVSDPDRALDRSGPLKVDEGDNKTYYVKLTEAPNAGDENNVVVTITSDNDDVTVDPETLTFTSGDATTPKVVTVTAAEDADAADERASLKHDVAGGGPKFDDMHPSPVIVAVMDNDVPGVEILQTGTDKAQTKALEPSDASDATGLTYRVRLSSMPSADVTVTIRSDNDHVQVSSTDDSTPSASVTLTFTTTDYMTAQTVTVTAVNDGDTVDESATLSHMASSSDNAYYIPSAGTVMVTIDDMTPGLVLGDVMVKEKDMLAQFSTTFAESASKSFTVKLSTEPTGDTVVTVKSDKDDVMVNGKKSDKLTFAMGAKTTQDPTTYGWGEAQMVTLTATDDTVDGNDRSATITLTADSGYTTNAATLVTDSDDAGFNQVMTKLAVTVSDDDDAAVMVGPLGAVPEGGSADFTVALATMPSDDVTIAISSDNAAVTVNPMSLMFTADNYMSAQTVMVMAAEDEDTDDGSAMLSLAVSSMDANYNGKSSELAVTVSDNDPVVQTVEVKVPGPTRTVTRTQTRTVTKTVEVPAAPNVIGETGQATATEVDGRVVIARHDGGASLAIDIGGFIRDETLGQTYQVVRRADGKIVRQWVSPGSPLVYQINWAVVNSAFTVPVGVIGAIPLDDMAGAEGQLVRRFDGGDDRIFSYAMGQWRHVPDIPTFQALGFYWCDVTAADAAFFDRISIGAPHAPSGMASRAGYPSCSTG